MKEHPERLQSIFYVSPASERIPKWLLLAIVNVSTFWCSNTLQATFKAYGEEVESILIPTPYLRTLTAAPADILLLATAHLSSYTIIEVIQ